MKRYRGFKLGRRLVRFWRWAVRRCPRRRPKHYLRLNHDTESVSKSNPCKTTTMTTKLFDWSRHLARRLRRGGGGSHRRIGARTPLLEGEGGSGWAPPPKGHLVVYVGKKEEEEGGQPRRYLVPVIYFNHPLFGELLREAEEEFGFHHSGGITIPCPVAKFERVRTRIAAADERPRRGGAASLWP